MKRRFNTTGSCNPQRHYVVRLDDRLKKIREYYVDDGSYFVINKGRQYGKTTTLKALENYLSNEYMVASLDFQQLGTEDFADESTFVRAFTEVLLTALQSSELCDSKILKEFIEEGNCTLKDLFVQLSILCKSSSRPIVLMIDEVDSASNNQVFVDFLAQLRSYYLNREKASIFHSVILAGVYDIKNLKLKLRSDSEHQYNSPWNIAADFDIVMSFSADQIAGMLEEYEADYHTGMDIQAVAEEIYAYTSGYPVLVSLICKRIDEKILGSDGFDNPQKAWSQEGIEKAVKIILIDRAPLFESMIRHLDEYSGMKKMFQAILFQGNEFSYSPDTKEISLACMFGYAVNMDGKVRIANRIFETRLYNYFLSEEELTSVMGKMA